MTESSDSFASVLDAAVALHRAQIDEDQFVAAVVGLPIVKQTPMPKPPGLIADAWLPAEGPVQDLQRVRSARLISNESYDRALDAMAGAGHQA